MDWWVEGIGYLGSALVIGSLMQKSILKLRLVGLGGSVVFFTYSLLIAAYPISIVNVIAATIHLYFLRKLLRRPNEVFSTLQVRPESRYLEAFLDFHARDITRFQPEFRYEPAENQFAAFVLRDMVPAGLIIGRLHEDGTVEIVLDYAIPEYRDFRLGKFLFSSQSGVFTDPAMRRAWSRATTEEHATYLRRMGFERVDHERFEIDLAQV